MYPETKANTFWHVPMAGQQIRNVYLRGEIIVASAKELENLLKTLSRLENNMARMEGEHNQLLKSLKEEGFENVDEAQKELDRLDEFIQTLGQEVDREYEDFQNLYGDKIAPF